ncbi:MAG: hypothetical protein BZ138_07045 [Methanosphaera sp. rholeuAM270]|nr:MAG: hypothetical protein BZ138_07045 [Methanosphaera sp. rholeuAM270]
MCYLNGNLIARNGQRIGVADGEPSNRKLPGVSLDNACYNVVAGNIFAGNYGSGVKAVRSSCRNIITVNEFASNNAGINSVHHFFGVELASDLKRDYEGAAGMDFAPCYENAVFANCITGGHSSGVYLGEGDARNAIKDNFISGFLSKGIEDNSTDASNEIKHSAAPGEAGGFRV